MTIPAATIPITAHTITKSTDPVVAAYTHEIDNRTRMERVCKKNVYRAPLLPEKVGTVGTRHKSPTFEGIWGRITAPLEWGPVGTESGDRPRNPNVRLERSAAADFFLNDDG